MYLSAKDKNTLDKAPEATCAAGYESYDDLDSSLAGVTEIEVVNSKAAKEETEKSCGELGLASDSSGFCSLLKAYAAGKTYGSAGVSGSSAVRAEAVTVINGNSALNANCSLFVQFVSTVTTIHYITPFYIKIRSTKITSGRRTKEIFPKEYIHPPIFRAAARQRENRDKAQA